MRNIIDCGAAEFGLRIEGSFAFNNPQSEIRNRKFFKKRPSPGVDAGSKSATTSGDGLWGQAAGMFAALARRAG
jgi:hypothetical protein